MLSYSIYYIFLYIILGLLEVFLVKEKYVCPKTLAAYVWFYLVKILGVLE